MRQKERRAAALSRFVGGLGREGGGPEKMNGVFNHGLAGWARIFCGAAESVLSAIRGQRGVVKGTKETEATEGTEAGRDPGFIYRCLQPFAPSCSQLQ